MLLFLPSSRALTRFVLSVAEVLRGESFPIWVLWVRGESGVQVCAKHMHEDLEPQSKCETKYPAADPTLMSETNQSLTFANLDIYMIYM